MNELVIKRSDGKRITTSLIVAVTFRKPHRNVLRDIEKLSCSKEFYHLNYVLLFSIRELPNGGSKKDPYYEITRDGFTFLAMGFTGVKAAEFKEKFIAEFERREEIINTQNALLDNDDAILARAFNILMNKQKALEIQIELKDEQLAISERTIKETAPKVQYHDEVLQSTTGHSITVIAAELGLTAQKLNKILCQMGVQRKIGKGKYVTYVLCEKYLNRGYTSSYTHLFTDSLGVERSSIHTTWTEVGRKWLIGEYKKYSQPTNYK